MFKSPQTGSIYEVVGKVCKDPTNRKESVKVCYRKFNEASYRVRIQGETEVLEGVKNWLPPGWSYIKSGDHVSVVVSKNELGQAVADAMRATMNSYLLGLVNACDNACVELVDEYEDEDGF